MEAAYSSEIFVPTNKFEPRHNLKDSPLWKPQMVQKAKSYFSIERKDKLYSERLAIP